jgi:hypothetical protein
MKVVKVHLTNLQNAEHFEFHADVLALIKAVTPAALKSAEQCAAYAALFASEDGIMRQIAKSAITARIAEADRARDIVFRGMVDAWRASMADFDPKTVEAAQRVAPVFETFGDVADEALAKESADIHNLLQELTEKHMPDVETLDLSRWISELDRRNVAVEELMRERYDETAGRNTGLELRAVRLQVDAAYVAVTDRVEALLLVEGGDAYADFIARLNARVERARNIVAARRGRAAAKK